MKVELINGPCDGEKFELSVDWTVNDILIPAPIEQADLTGKPYLELRYKRALHGKWLFYGYE